MSAYRPEFEAALRLLARISKAMDDAGHRPPVLVGGAAVEIYTRGAVTTGDFDLSCGRQDVLEAEMQRQGFVRPSGRGKATRGWIHPDLKLGFECVSDTLLDGMADRAMIQVVSLGEDYAASVADVVAGLQAHGVTAEADSRPDDADAGRALLRIAADRGADLLVMGAYGRARLRELILGGATRDVLREAKLPVLFSA